MSNKKTLSWSYEKNQILKKERGISFEDIVLSIEDGKLLDDLEHPNRARYQNQNIFIVLVPSKNYVYMVPYIEDERTIFLKTIIPSRVMNKKYNKGEQNEQSR